jgi:hypothetical protein
MHFGAFYISFRDLYTVHAQVGGFSVCVHVCEMAFGLIARVIDAMFETLHARLDRMSAREIESFETTRDLETTKKQFRCSMRPKAVQVRRRAFCPLLSRVPSQAGRRRSDGRTDRDYGRRSAVDQRPPSSLLNQVIDMPDSPSPHAAGYQDQRYSRWVGSGRSTNGWTAR